MLVTALRVVRDVKRMVLSRGFGVVSTWKTRGLFDLQWCKLSGAFMTFSAAKLQLPMHEVELEKKVLCVVVSDLQ